MARKSKKNNARLNLTLAILSLSIGFFLVFDLVIFTSLTRPQYDLSIPASSEEITIGTLSEPVTNPKCIGFEVLNSQNQSISETAASNQLNLNVNPNDQFFISAVAMDGDGSLVGKPMSICWTVAGQSPDFYRMGPQAYSCYSAASHLGTLENSGAIRNSPEVFEEYVQELLNSPKITDSNKEIIRQNVNQQGLVFVYNFYDDSRELICSSNIGWNEGKGVISSNGDINTNANQCATTVFGRTCNARIRVNNVNTQTICNGDNNTCADNEICDTSTNKCSANASRLCVGSILSEYKSASCLDFNITNHICSYKDKANGTVCSLNGSCRNGYCVEGTNPTPVPTPTPVVQVQPNLVVTPISPTPVPVSATNYSDIKTLKLNIRLGSRPEQSNYTYPTIFVGIWREEGDNSKFLVNKVFQLSKNVLLEDTTLLSQNGNGYTLDQNDYLVIKPEGYLSKAYQLKNLNIPQNVINLFDTTPYIAGDVVYGKGTFDSVNTRDRAFYKTFFGRDNKYDYYYMDFNGDGSVNILDGGMMYNNDGKTGDTRNLNELIIPAMESALERELYKIIPKN